MHRLTPHGRPTSITMRKRRTTAFESGVRREIIDISVMIRAESGREINTAMSVKVFRTRRRRTVRSGLRNWARTATGTAMRSDPMISHEGRARQERPRFAAVPQTMTTARSHRFSVREGVVCTGS